MIKVLYVDDMPECLSLIQRVLARRGEVEYYAAEVASEGIALCEKVDPDVVLVDIGLPGAFDGFDVVHALRGNGFCGLIVALTARADGETRVRCEREGFDFFLAKPFDVLGLLPRLKVLLGVDAVSA